jgi:hypothetical protein
MSIPYLLAAKARDAVSATIGYGSICAANVRPGPNSEMARLGPHVRSAPCAFDIPGIRDSGRGLFNAQRATPASARGRGKLRRASSDRCSPGATPVYKRLYGAMAQNNCSVSPGSRSTTSGSVIPNWKKIFAEGAMEPEEDC